MLNVIDISRWIRHDRGYLVSLMKKTNVYSLLLAAALLLAPQSSAETIRGGFYDLKRLASSEPSKLKCNASTGMLAKDGSSQALRLVAEFFAKDWNTDVFKDYFYSGDEYMVTHFFMPSADATYMSKCLNLKLKPSGICVLYRGSVKSPMTGKIRFVGAGDDLLAVRFDNKLVLEAGNMLPSLYNSKLAKTKDLWSKLGVLGSDSKYQKSIKRYRKGDDYALIRHDSYPNWNKHLGGLVVGPTVEVTEGQEYPIEVLYAEIDGKNAGYVLLYQDVSSTEGDNATAGVKLFRTSFVLPSIQMMSAVEKSTGEHDPFPEFEKDTPIWQQ